MKKFEKKLIAAFSSSVMALSLFSTFGLTPKADSIDEYQAIYEGTQAANVISDIGGTSTYVFVPEKTGNYSYYSVGESDTYVNVYDSTGNIILSDNDSGDDFNFKITQVFEEGNTYYLESKLFDDSTGEFETDLVLVEADEVATEVVDEATEDVLEDVEETDNNKKDEKPDVSNDQVAGDFTYKLLSDGTAAITSYNGETASLTIPKQINGVTVTTIEYMSFYETSVVDITFEEGSEVKSIGDKAFILSSLQNITLPGSLVTIGGAAFADTNIGSIIIPDSVTDIGAAAFSGCNKLSEVKLSTGIDAIKDDTFSYCSALKTIDIPDNVTKIGFEAFMFCDLNSIIISDSVVSIDKYAFFGNKNLTKVEIGNKLAYVADNAFENCGVIDLSLGDSVKTIGNYSFAENDINSLVIPDSVTEIQYRSFLGNKNLKDITFSANIEKINAFAFEDTAWYNAQPDGLIYTGKAVLAYKGAAPVDGKVTVNDGIKGIGACAFYDVDLSIVELPEGLTNIGYGAFANTGLKEIYIPSSVTEIGDYALGYTSNWIYDDTISGVAKVEDFIIYGSAGSAAEKYAEDNGFEFVARGWQVDANGIPTKLYDDNGDIVKSDSSVYVKFIEGPDGKPRAVNSNGDVVINDFVCDGVYTYYVQLDGSPMENRLTYHPDGNHVIYFDENGHEVFSNFANVKMTISGEEVNDFCFFDVYGYMYVDVLTYDVTGTVLYYANPYGVMEMGKWFQFSDTVAWADGTPAEGIAGGYGYANEDGTLMTNTATYDWEGRSCYLQGNGVALYE